MHFVPSQPESLQEIINKFAEKEARVQSLQKFWAMQNDELAALERQVDPGGVIDGVAASSDHAGAAEPSAAAGSGPSSPSPLPPAEGQTAAQRAAAAVEQQEKDERSAAQFEGICKLIDGMFRVATTSTRLEATAAPTGLEASPCSSSTVDDFLSCLDSRLDEIEIVAAALRDHAIGSQHLSVRKPNEVLERFLCSRSMRPLSTGQHSLDSVKKKLPSIADQGADQEGEGDTLGQPRRAERSKGGIDRHKRDQEIAAWVQRQKDSRAASTRPEGR